MHSTILSKRRPLPRGVPVANWEQVDKQLQSAIREAIKSERWPIYLYGQHGTGKTCAAAFVYCRWPQHAMWHDHPTVIREVISCRTSGTVTRFSNDRSYELTEGQILRLGQPPRYLTDRAMALSPTAAHRRTSFVRVRYFGFPTAAFWGPGHSRQVKNSRKKFSRPAMRRPVRAPDRLSSLPNR